MHYHGLDEFSVTDVRHTVHEVWRVVCSRRWYFMVPFSAAATLALLGSLLLPRSYTASTTIKREHDPVFASLMGSGWTQPYEELRSRMGPDMVNRELVEGALADAGLPGQVSRYADGSLTVESTAAHDSLVAEIIEGLKTSTVEKSASRDVIAISLSMSNPHAAEQILPRLRDRYMAWSNERVVEILQSVRQFFDNESRRTSASLAEVQRQIAELEMKYPGIDPTGVDSFQSQQTSFMLERVKIERELDEFELQRDRVSAALAALTNPGSPEAGAASAAPVRDQVNPAHEKILAEIDQAQREITEGKTVRLMTDAHPSIRRMRSRLGELKAQLAQTPARIASSELSALVGDVRNEADVRRERLESELSELGKNVALREGRLADLQNQAGEVESRRALALEHRRGYLNLKDEAERLRGELVTWQQNIAPIERVLHLEDRDRSVHFTTVKEASAVLRPSAPDARLILAGSLGIGAALGALVVVLAEFLDRSFRTVKRLSTSLGMPVIEGIDEIMTAASRRRERMRAMVVRPAAALLLMLSVVFSGLLAYVSVENPTDFEMLRSSPSRAFRWLVGQT